MKFTFQVQAYLIFCYILKNKYFMFNFQWITLRLSALNTILGFLIDIEIIFLVSGFILLHINLGLQTIVYDYIHVKKVKFISSTLIRISLIEIARHILELLI